MGRGAANSHTHLSLKVITVVLPFARQIFSVGDAVYTWGDVVLAGILWGDWENLAHEVSAGLACLERLDDAEDEEEPLPEDEVNAAAEEFRYARDLVAAEDMEAWLERRGLTVDEWMGYIERSLLVKKWVEDLEAIQREYPVALDEAEEVILCDAICGGRADAWAKSLATRAAAYARTIQESPEGDGAAGNDAVGALAEEFRDSLAAHPLILLRAIDPERVNLLAGLEMAWREFSESRLTPHAIREQVAAHQLEWLRLSFSSLVLKDRDAAREAALCIRDDGRSPAEVAADSKAELTEGEWFLDEVDGALRSHLVGATGGDVLGPLEVNDGFAIVSVHGKRPASAEDPLVRARAERSLLGRTVHHEIESRVRWIAPL